MTDVPTPDDYPGRGQLPDKLAFVKPTRARAYIVLERAERPLMASDLSDRLGCSKPTAYRCLNDLEDLGLVTDATHFGTLAKPETGYKTTELETEPIRADGGTDQ